MGRNLKVTLMGLMLLFSFNCSSHNTGITVNVKTLGAKGDGKADDTSFILDAFKQLANSGGTIYFPSGTYLTNIINIRPLPGKTIRVIGDRNKTLIRKNVLDKTNIALFFCEVKDVSLTFQNIICDGQALSRRGKWHLSDRRGVIIDEEIIGIYGYNLTSLTVISCRIQNFHGKGIAAFNTRRLVAENNVVNNVNDSGIQGHRVQEMIVKNNIITNTGFVSVNDIVEGVAINTLKGRPATLFGDGIEAECNSLVATGNQIINPGRCGITHDLARDLGYLKSYAEVTGNTVLVNSRTISNNNPPAGMWFEQSSRVNVSKNKIKFQSSSSKFISGIRFYGITNCIVCGHNVIEATGYNFVSDAGIGIYEPSVEKIEISCNVVTGNFLQGITLSYGDKSSVAKKLSITKNYIEPQKENGGGLKISVGERCNFPAQTLLLMNNFNVKESNVYHLSYYGLLHFLHQTKSVFRIRENKIRGQILNKLPGPLQGVVYIR